MAIYLDANVLFKWRTFAEPERLALSIVAAQLGQDVVVPWVAAEESAANHRRSLEAPLAALDAAKADVARAFNQHFDFEVEPWPAIEEDVARWRAALEELASIAPLSDAHAREALRREMYGIAPARRTPKTGVGGRDAAIWLTIAADHGARDEPGHFITGNSKDFTSDGVLRHELVAELPDGVAPLQWHDGITAFLGLLGESRPNAAVTVEELERRAVDAVRRGLSDASSVIAAITDERSPRFRYRAVIKAAEPLSVTHVKRYEREGEAVTIVDAKWRLNVHFTFQDSTTDSTESWWSFDDLHVEGPVQVYLVEEDGAERDAELIGAQLSSDVWVGLPDSGGRVIYSTTLRD